MPVSGYRKADFDVKQESKTRRAAQEAAYAYEYVWRSPWVRAASWTVVIAALVTVLVLLFPRYSVVLTVGLVGVLLAYLLHPLVTLLQRARIPRALAVILVFLALLGLMVLGSIRPSRATNTRITASALGMRARCSSATSGCSK